MMNIIFACDLDNTLVYSESKISGGICVEIYNDRQQGFMTERTYKNFGKIAENIRFIPVTTRSVEQFRRIKFPDGFIPEYALASNGATLLHNGEPVEEWELIRRDEKLRELLNIVYSRYCDDSRFRICRMVDNAFVYVVCSDEENSLKIAEELRAKEEISVEVTGRKIYFFPDGLNKGAAVKKLSNMLSAEKIIAAGDSSMDAPMLNIADIALIPDNFDMRLIKSEKYIKCSQNSTFSDFIVEKLLEFF